MIRSYLLILAIFISLGNAYAQKVVLERKVDTVMARPNFGPNQNNFVHGFASLLGHITTNTVQELDVLPLSSLGFNLGVRYKKKLTRNHAVIADMAFSYNNFRFSEREFAIIQFPNKTKEMIRTVDFDFAAYARIGIGSRGDYIGKFVDVGYYFSQPLLKTYVVFAEKDNGQMMRRKTPNTGYLVGNWQHGPKVQIGLNRYVFIFQYRLSDYFFANGFPMTHIPRFTTGFQIGFH